MIDRNYLYNLRRDLKSQAEGLAIQRAAILSQIASIEKLLGIDKEKNNGRPKAIAESITIESAKQIEEAG